MCCSASIGITPCCAPQLLPIISPPMPLLPPPLPLIGAGCCPCCMPMCVPMCVRSSCGGMFGGGLFGGGGCPFGGWKQKRTVKRKRTIRK
uniref:Uncharacterized protein n=1 Tax=Globodera rostochiensis TaxID=31243 RepID=A0A914IHD0_GLORO